MILIIRAIKGYSHSFRITCDRCSESAREQRIALYKSYEYYYYYYYYYY